MTQQMRREEKRRKFHESLLNTLYPPQPQPQSKSDDETHSTSTTTFDVNLIPDDYGLNSASTSDDNEDGGESESVKLTRAQRKRRRKKKLKEDNSRRKQLIGPLKPLPSNESDGGSAREKCTPPVRQNANESCCQSKVKQRRMTKKLVKERLIKPSDIKDSLEDQSFDLINGENRDDDRKSKTDGQTFEEDQYVTERKVAA